MKSLPWQLTSRRRRSYGPAGGPRTENPPPAGHSIEGGIPHGSHGRISHPPSRTQKQQQDKRGAWRSVLTSVWDSAASSVPKWEEGGFSGPHVTDSQMTGCSAIRQASRHTTQRTSL